MHACLPRNPKGRSLDACGVVSTIAPLNAGNGKCDNWSVNHSCSVGVRVTSPLRNSLKLNNSTIRRLQSAAEFVCYRVYEIRQTDNGAWLACQTRLLTSNKTKCRVYLLSLSGMLLESSTVELCQSINYQLRHFMYQTRIKWAELWFRALGYNDDYELYCTDMTYDPESIDEDLLVHYPVLPKLYSFFGDIYSYMRDSTSPYTIEDYGNAFNQWLKVNRYKLMPLVDGINEVLACLSNDLIRNRIANVVNKEESFAELFNQPELDLYKVENWDSDNNIESIEKRLDVYHLLSISRITKLELIKWIAESGKPCWQKVADNINFCIQEEGEYSDKEVTIDNITFDAVRSVYDNQIKQLVSDTYTIVQSSIIGRFPSHFKIER